MGKSALKSKPKVYKPRIIESEPMNSLRPGEAVLSKDGITIWWRPPKGEGFAYYSKDYKERGEKTIEVWEGPYGLPPDYGVEPIDGYSLGIFDSPAKAKNKAKKIEKAIEKLL